MSKFNDSLGGWGGVGSDLRLGLDVGDRQSSWAAMNLATGEVREGVMATTPEGVEECFGGLRGCIVLMEAGTHSPWLARKLNELGQRAVVTDPAVLGGGGRRRRKNDRNDARELMELARDVGRPRLKELWQRPEAYQEDLALMRIRDAAVRARTLLANATRGTVKQFGERVDKHSVASLPKFARLALSEQVHALVEPALEQVEALTRTVDSYDTQVAEYLRRRPESERLLQVHGVGPVTAGVFMAVVGDPKRFKRSRDVAAYLGLVPGIDQSGDQNPQLRISKTGDALARRVLVQCAHYIMSNNGQDSALRRWALGLAGDAKNKARKRRAVVALARRLAVLLHRLWVSGERYEPLRGIKQEGAQAA